MEQIRNAEEKDIPEVLALLEQVNKIHHDGRPDIFNLATKYSHDELKNIFQDKNTPVFVYENDGKILGYAFCIMTEHKGERLLADMKTLYIDDICVDEKARGQHVGKKLYEKVLSHARAEHCHNVTLNVWALNEPTRKFYEKLGMKIQKIGMEQIL